MMATIVNPYGKKKRKKASKIKKAKKVKAKYTRESVMARKKTRKRKHNPANPSRGKKRHARRKKRNPVEQVGDILIGGAMAAVGGFANNLLSGGVSKLVSSPLDPKATPEAKMKYDADQQRNSNIIKLVTAGLGGMFLPKFIPRQYALPAVYGAFGSVGASMLESMTGIRGEVGAASLDVQRIIDEIDAPKTSGLIETSGEFDVKGDDETSGEFDVRGDDDMSGDDMSGEDYS